VNRAVDVGVVVLIKILDGFNYLSGFLRGCGIIKVD
jgi:hypothetical protein